MTVPESCSQSGLTTTPKIRWEGLKLISMRTKLYNLQRFTPMHPPSCQVILTDTLLISTTFCHLLPQEPVYHLSCSSLPLSACADIYGDFINSQSDRLPLLKIYVCICRICLCRRGSRGSLLRCPGLPPCQGSSTWVMRCCNLKTHSARCGILNEGGKFCKSQTNSGKSC